MFQIAGGIALIVIGAFLLLSLLPGISETIEGLINRQVKTGSWSRITKIAIIITGIFFFFWGILITNPITFNASPAVISDKNLCDDYGFEIIEPSGGYTFENGKVRIEGTVKNLPSLGNIQLLNMSNDSGPITYWPQSVITFDPTTKKWSGVIYSSYNVIAAVVIVGENGSIFFDYFDRVYDSATSQGAAYPGFRQLPKDVLTCKTVPVRQP